MPLDTQLALATPLEALHLERGGRMVPFAGYCLPVQYPSGILKEHLQVRRSAGLFDISHMGQIRVSGPAAAAALETLVPADLQNLEPGRIRYTVLTDAAGGILDDLMVTNRGDHLFLVVNAACKHADLAHLRHHLGQRLGLELLEHRALLALQGPQAAAVLARWLPQAATMPFMSVLDGTLDGQPVLVSRCGYTGEDGYELSLAAGAAEAVARQLLAQPEVAPIGLGARDSLRLEAGLCLYGHDIDRSTTPVAAGLGWSIGKRRRLEGGFPGDAVILEQFAHGASRRRVGLRLDGRQPAREHTPILDAAGTEVGLVTSGGFGPSVNGPIAMGYVPPELARPGTALSLLVRGKTLPATVTALPFVPQNYYRG